jgi:hypothetical protein
MLNPRYQLYVVRLAALIDEGEAVTKSATGRSSDYDHHPYVQPCESAPLHAWITKVENILRSIFGEKSAHFIHYSKFAYDGIRNHLQEIGDIIPIIGILHGAKDDLENGFLLNQELLVSAVVFDNILEQAKHLCDTGYKDPAAVLARVVLEGSLRNMARQSSLDDSAKASAINEELRKTGRYNQPQWRQIQAWLDIGNAAAHGNFSQYTREQVASLIDGVAQFVASGGY